MASSSRVRYLLVFWPGTGTGDLSDGTMVFVSFNACWHWIVAGFLSPNQDCYMVLVFFINPIGASELENQSWFELRISSSVFAKRPLLPSLCVLRWT